MLWKLKNRLFGWHYVRIEFGWSYKTARVLMDGDGEPYVFIYGNHITLRSPGYHKWYPLTFSRSDLLGEPPAKILPIRGSAA